VLVQSIESRPKFDMTRCEKRGMDGVLQIYEEVIRLVPLYDISDGPKTRDSPLVLYFRVHVMRMYRHTVEDG
jgi:hypothetical protein